MMLENIFFFRFRIASLDGSGLKFDPRNTHFNLSGFFYRDLLAEPEYPLNKLSIQALRRVQETSSMDLFVCNDN